MGNLSLGRTPYFRAGRFVMGKRIVRIVELVQQYSFSGCRHLLGKITRIFNATAFRRQYNFRAIHCNALLFEIIGAFRHDHNGAITTGSSHHRQRNSGIATCCLDQGVTWPDFATFFSVADHCFKDTILDGAGWIATLPFPENKVPATFCILTRRTEQLHQGSGTDCPFNCCIWHIQVDRLSRKARAMVPTSTYSSSAPTGTPLASLLTLIPRTLSISLM